MNEDYKDLFYEWLSSCPVQWVLNEEFDGSVTYTFHFDAEDKEKV